MKSLRRFDIHIFKLSIGEHQYSFEIDETFFESFESDLVSKGKLQAEVLLQKSERMIEMHFDIAGSIELECDRSLDKFDYPLKFEKRMIFKFGETEEELSDEVMVIPMDAQLINVADLIFEFIGIEIPMKKLHPRFEEEESDEEGELIYSSGEEAEQESEENQENVDPRWEALKQLKK